MGQATAERTAPATYVYKKQEDVQKKVGGYTQQQQKVKELTYEERLKKLQKYEPVIPQAPTDMKFHYYKEDGSLGIRAKLKMIESVDELKEFAKRCVGKMVGLDTETTGLTFYKDKIVGFSLALTDMEGYYVPIRHQIRHTTTVKENKVDENGNYVLTKTGKISTHTVKTHTYEPSPYNLPDKECLDILYKIMLNAKVSLWHNSNFDLNMLKAEGYDVMKCKTFDTLVLPYIYDAEGRGISGLKDLEKRLLGRYRPGFKEVVGSDENFQYTDPTVSQAYASCDATSVIAIYNKLCPMVKDLLAQAPSIIELDGKKYNIVQEDNNLIRAFVDYYDHAELKVDPQVARDYEKVVKEGLAKTSAEIYEFFGRGPFSLSTQSKEFQKVMQDYHIETGAVTDKGNKAFGKKGVKEFNKNLNYLKNTVFPNVKYLKFNENKQFGSKLPKKDQATRELNSIAYTLTGIIKTYGKDYCKWVDQVNNLVIKNLDGSMATRMDFYEILKKMYHGELAKLNVLKKVQQVSSYNKALNSYISKLTEVESCRLKYNVTSTSSSRLSGGLGRVKKGQEDTYFINLNPQNLTKPKSQYWRGFQGDGPKNILGWEFEPVTEEYAHANKDKEVIVEAGTSTANVRKCFVAPEDRYIVSMDFCVSPETTVELQGGKRVPITYLEDNPQMIKTPKGYELAHNFHYTGKRRKCVLTLKSGKTIVCSPDHKFLVSYEGYTKWLPLKDITSSMYIWEQDHDNNIRPKSNIACIEFTGEYIDMCDITVGDSHSYYANGIVTHNCNQEARILALMSQDPRMLNIFLTGEDMHTSTAVAIFGEAGHDKKYRKIAKAINFAMAYQGNEYTVANNLDIPIEEARGYVEAYYDKFPQSIRWKKQQIQQMYQQGGKVYTLFGRPRQFITRLKSASTCGDEKISQKIQNAVERRVPSHIIQGLAGDVCRHILLSLYRRFFKHRDPNIDFYSTVHDEVSYSIRKECAVEYIKELQDIMTFRGLNGQFNLDTSIAVGHNLGQVFDFTFSDETKTTLVPVRI